MVYDQDHHYLDKVLAGDAAAFAFLVDKYRRMAFTIALKVVKSREDAEEIAQDAFIKVYKSLHTFQRTSKFSTWLYRIVTNEAISRTRRKTLEVSAVDDHITDRHPGDSGIGGLETLTQEQRKFWIKQAMDTLPEDTALVIMLFYLEEQTIEEISQITGITEENIKVRLHRGRKKLSSELERLLRDELEGIR
jgi:RNA polymerase sigma-70 factor (ECF subfamily)